MIGATYDISASIRCWRCLGVAFTFLIFIVTNLEGGHDVSREFLASPNVGIKEVNCKLVLAGAESFEIVGV